MATPLFSTPPAPGRTTPQRLHLAQVSILVSVVLFFLAVFYGARHRNAAVQAIGKDSAPSILAAQKIKANLADMDANLANELMFKPGDAAQSVKGYNDDRQVVSDSLVRAAENITYGDLERKPIQTIAFGLGAYEEQAARARVLHEKQDPQAIEVYRRGTQTLHETLFPAADALSKANNDALNAAYDSVQVSSLISFVFLLASGGALLGALILTQIFLSGRMKRTLNPALLVATLLTGWMLLHTISAFGKTGAQLKIAKKDAFDSVVALWQARAIAFDSNTDESRWLLDHANAAEYEEAFFTKSALLLTFPKAQMYDRVADVASSGTVPADVKGYLADELHNITFDGEKEAATDTLQTFGVYFEADKKIRALENAGDHAGAIKFCTGINPGDSNWAFLKFDAALGKTLDLNESAFNTAVENGFDAVKGFDTLAPIVAVIIAILAIVGLRPRHREYM